MTRQLYVVLLALGLGLGVSAKGSAKGVISPHVRAMVGWHKLARARGLTVPQTRFFGVLRLTHALTPGLRGQLEALGVGFHHVEGRILHHGELVPARIPVGAVASLAKHPSVRRLDAYSAGRLPKWSDSAHASVELDSTTTFRDVTGQMLTGAGVVVGNIDGAIDVFHPDFFFADAGLYPWVDSDASGSFSPGADGVLMKAQDEPRPLRVLDNPIRWDPNDGQWHEPDPSGAGFQADVDWLYVDANNNGERDFGPLAGYPEETPAYGEPIFIVDDLNRNGVLDLGEKLLQLGTSKIRAVYRPAVDLVRRRGVDLILTPRPTESSHGTMTVGVLAGGHWSRRFRGVAPEVEVNYVDFGAKGNAAHMSPVTAGLLWLKEEGVDVMMHEYGTPIGQFGDGSSEQELAMDELSDLGIPQCTATHNYAGYPGHASVSLVAGETITFDVQVGTAYGPSLVHYYTLRWRPPLGGVSLSLKFPDGSVLPLGSEPKEFTHGDHLLTYTGIDTSDRGTSMAVMTLGRYAGADWIPLVEGVYQLEVTATEDTGGKVDLFVNDEHGYLLGSAILDHVTVYGTLAHPSTADSAIGTGAYAGNLATWSSLGDLAFYSGRGPRIDGDLGIDLVAPADGMAAESDPTTPFPSMSTAAGTSGALPQVAGVVALLKQYDGSLSSEAVLGRLVAGAIADDYTGAVPNPSWGYGKVSAFRTVLQTAPWENQPPTALIEAPTSVEIGTELTLSAAQSHDPEDPAEQLKVRWDVGYQGQWSEPTGIGEVLLIADLAELGSVSVVAEVFDPLGAFQRVLVQVEVVETTPIDEALAEVAADIVVGPGAQDASEIESDDLAAEPAKKKGKKGTPGCVGCTSGPLGLPPISVLFVVAYFLLYRPRGRSAMRGMCHENNMEI